MSRSWPERSSSRHRPDVRVRGEKRTLSKGRATSVMTSAEIGLWLTAMSVFASPEAKRAAQTE